MALTSSAENHIYEANPFRELANGYLTNTVTFVSFSRDGALLVIGCADGQLFVVEIESWVVTRRRRLPGHGDYPVSAIWTQHRVLYVGTRAGDVHQLLMGSSSATDKHTFWHLSGPVYALAYIPLAGNKERLGISSGPNAYVQDLESFLSGEVTRGKETPLPAPGAFPGMINHDTNMSPKVKAVSLEFLSDTGHLVGTYRHHGIVIWDNKGHLVHRVTPHSVGIGRAVLSLKGDKLYATNLCDGIDIYKIDKRRWSRSTFERTTQTEFGVNKPLPIVCIHEGAEVLVGGMLGKVQALSVDGAIAKVNLSRAAPAQARGVQAIAYTVVQGSHRTHYIAYGASEAGANTAVHVYRGTDKIGTATSLPRLTKASGSYLRTIWGSIFGAIWTGLLNLCLYILSFTLLISLFAVALWIAYQAGLLLLRGSTALQTYIGDFTGDMGGPLFDSNLTSDGFDI